MKFRMTILSLLLLAACTEKELPPDGEANRLALSLRMELPRQLSVSATRAGNPSRDGIEITKVRVLQFDKEAGTETYTARKTYSEVEHPTDVAEWFTLTDAGLVVINTGRLDADKFWDRNSNFYVMANAKDELYSAAGSDICGTVLEPDLSGAYFSFPVTDAIAATEPGILTYGPMGYVHKGGLNPTPVAIFARLKRAYAKVTVNYTTGTGITITGVRIENVPTRIYPFPAAGNTVTEGFGNIETGITLVEVAPDSGSSGSTTSSYTFSFFMPENLRGNGTATNEQGKNLPANGPTTDTSNNRSLDYCTCIVLAGTYDYYPGSAPPADPISVEYRFYPGSDMIRNYDIERGKHYTLTLNLKGANSADARVTITDGNVFTVADPDDVTHDDDIVFGN